jgi:hypothetical protein
METDQAPLTSTAVRVLALEALVILLLWLLQHTLGR